MDSDSGSSTSYETEEGKRRVSSQGLSPAVATGPPLCLPPTAVRRGDRDGSACTRNSRARAAEKDVKALNLGATAIRGGVGGDKTTKKDARKAGQRHDTAEEAVPTCFRAEERPIPGGTAILRRRIEEKMKKEKKGKAGGIGTMGAKSAPTCLEAEEPEPMAVREADETTKKKSHHRPELAPATNPHPPPRSSEDGRTAISRNLGGPDKPHPHPRSGDDDRGYGNDEAERSRASPEVLPTEEPTLPWHQDDDSSSSAPITRTAPVSTSEPDAGPGNVAAPLRQTERTGTGTEQQARPRREEEDSTQIPSTGDHDETLARQQQQPRWTPSGGGHALGGAISARVVHDEIDSWRVRRYIRSMAADAPLVEVRVVPEDDHDKGGSHDRRRKWRWWIVVVLLVVAAVVGALSGALVSRRGDSGGSTTPTPAAAPAPSNRSDEILSVAISISGASVFRNSTPQNMALDWLLNNDTYSAPLSLAEVGERYVLAVLYYSMGGQRWAKSIGFLGDTHVCDGWFLVLCEHRAGMDGARLVTGLLFEDNGLSGSIPEEVTHLIMLNELNLRENGEINGTIPWNIGVLGRLEELDLSFNRLSGSLPPGIVNLTSLRKLLLVDNPLSGTIPSNIGNLAMLEVLAAGWTKDAMKGVSGLTGTIPPSMGSLQKLQWLSLSSNYLSGTLPAEICNLANIQHLSFYWNELTGQIPTCIGNLGESLSYFDLNGNKLSGAIPSSIGKLRKLRFLRLSGNDFSGSIPSTLWNLTSLAEVEIMFNELTGTLSEHLGNLKNLMSFNFGYNDMTGELPSSIGHLVNLEGFGISENTISGSIPDTVGDLNNLKDIALNGNLLEGSIPTELSKLKGLTVIDLSSNEIGGTIPSVIGLLKNLEWLYLSSNQLTGTIPNELGNLTKLEDLQLDGNNLVGSLPKSICQSMMLTEEREEDVHMHISADCSEPFPEVYCSCCEDCY